MAAYSSSQSGDWNQSSTWGLAGVPGAGDTAQINNTHEVRVDPGTGDVACLSYDIKAGGRLTIDDENTAPVSLTFDDAADAGEGASAGDIRYIGTPGNGITITSAGTPTGSTKWRWSNALDRTATYTTFDYCYQVLFNGSATIDIQNCTFDHTGYGGGGKDFLFSVTPTITSFDDNTIQNGTGTNACVQMLRNIIIDNLTMTGNAAPYDIQSDQFIGYQVELTNSSFDFDSASDNEIAGPDGYLLSYNHNNVANAIVIQIADGRTVAKSAFTNDFASGDNVTLFGNQRAGTDSILTIDENAAFNDMTINSNLDVNVSAGVSWTVDAGGTVTVESGADLNFNGSDGSLVTLRSGTPTSAWYLTDNNSPGVVGVTYTDVQDSDASGGIIIIANDGTNVNSLRNPNWDFGGRGVPTTRTSLFRLLSQDIIFPFGFWRSKR